MKFLVKIFPEITVKSRPVRQKFVSQLRRNLCNILSRIDADIKVEKFWDHLEVIPSTSTSEILDSLAEELCRIPGIQNVLTTSEHRFQTVHEIFEITLRENGNQLDGKTFCVRVKRKGQHDFKSTDVEKYVGGGLLEHTQATSVKLKDPDTVVHLEIDGERLFVIQKRLTGMGGYPLGTQERVLSLISGGYDSSLASYFTMRRGVKTNYCFFNLGGHAHEVGVKQVAHFLWAKYGSSHKVRFISVPFEKVTAEILDKVHHSHRGVILKRMMLRAAAHFADQMGIDALVTGEAVAQVSSQTLPNLAMIDRAVPNLVIRPLAMMDKQDIIDQTRLIGVEELTRNIPEYCGVISDKPTTNASQKMVDKGEEAFDFEVLKEAIEQAVSMNVDEVMDCKTSPVGNVEIVNTPASQDVIIDIRHPEEIDKRPLSLSNNEVVEMPFYSINSQFSSLNSEKTYLLFCEKGTMSHMHAIHLKSEGHENVKVYKR